MKAIGQLDHENPHILAHRDEHLAEINPQTAVVSMLMVSKSSAPEIAERMEIARSLVKAGEDFASHQGEYFFIIRSSYLEHRLRFSDFSKIQ